MRSCLRLPQEADESLNFEEQILEAAKSIAAATSALVKAASAAQRELVAQGKVGTGGWGSVEDSPGAWPTARGRGRGPAVWRAVPKPLFPPAGGRDPGQRRGRRPVVPRPHLCGKPRGQHHKLVLFSLL